MHKTVQLGIGDLNPHLLCVLCSGYLVDATTIIECLHSFCRSCIVRYLETSKYCPICDVQIHKTKPLLNIRSDKTLQDIVYKLVPGIFKDEMKRRRVYYADNPDLAKKVKNREELGRVDECHRIYTEDEKLSVCLQHCVRLPPYHNGSSFNGQARKDTRAKGEEMRYLLCPAAMTVGLVKKFIRMKFELTAKYQIEVFHSDEGLKDDYTLMDVAYIYAWRMTEPLKLYYIVFDRTKFILDHGGTESDSSLLTDPGGGTSFRRKKVKGRRYKLGSNEDSDSPSECATPNYVLRPVDINKPSKKLEHMKKNLSEIAADSETKTVKPVTSSNPEVAVAVVTESINIGEAKLAAAANVADKEDVVIGEKEHVTMATEEEEDEVDEEDIPLALLKKKLTEQKVPPTPPKHEGKAEEEEEGSCDLNGEHGSSSDSDTTSYEVHSGVEENHVFSDLEDNDATSMTMDDGNSSGGGGNDTAVTSSVGGNDSGVSKTMEEPTISCSNTSGDVGVNNCDTDFVEVTGTVNRSPGHAKEGSSTSASSDKDKSHHAEETASQANVYKAEMVRIEGAGGAAYSSFVPSSVSNASTATSVITSTLPVSVLSSFVSPCTSANVMSHTSTVTKPCAMALSRTSNTNKTVLSSLAVVQTTDDKSGIVFPPPALCTSHNSSTRSISMSSGQPVNNNYMLLELKSSCVPPSFPVSSSRQSSPSAIIPADSKPVLHDLGSGPVVHTVIAPSSVSSSVLASHGTINNNSLSSSGSSIISNINSVRYSNGIAIGDSQPLYSQISHSYPATDGQLKKEVLNIKRNIVMSSCNTGSKVKGPTPSLAAELLTQFGADVLQSINPLQKVETIVEGIKRKRGRPPKDKTKLLAQIKAQQSPAKLPRLLPKGINGTAGPFYHHGNNAMQPNGHGHLQPSAQLVPVSTNMSTVQPYGCIAAPVNGLPIFGQNPMVNFSQLQNNRMMTANGPFLQTIGNTLFQPTQASATAPFLRPINGHFQNAMLSPTHPGLAQNMDTMAAPAADTKKPLMLSNHSNHMDQCIDEPIMPITIAPKMEKVEQ